jgi:predicted Rossmann fold flavoprotein
MIKLSKVIIVGGGAAGMLAAIGAAKNNHEVVLCEKNEKLGKKIYITGKGRCNITNACDLEDFFKNIVRNEKFMYSSLYGFTNQDLMDLLEHSGCQLKVERGNRVFPVSDHSSDVIKTLQHILTDLNVSVRYQSRAKKILISNQKVDGVLLASGEEIYGDAIIIATGGLSYPTTGSTGDGYEFAKKVGHTIVETVPGLVPFVIKESWCQELQGLALKNVSVQLFVENKKVYEELGEMLFTHFGVSGPLILSASNFYQNKKNGTKLVIDLKPALTEEQLDKRILREFEEQQNKQFKNSLQKLFPVKLIPIMIQLSGIHSDKKVHEITKEERLRFGRLIKNVELTVNGTRDFQEAIITRGGISVKELNPSTMESKLIKNLYFAGEMLDIHGHTGGYNLQIAFSTGFLAGSSIE